MGSDACAIAAVTACLWAPLLWGAALGFSGPAIDTMKNEVGVDGPEPIYPGSDLWVFTNGQASTYSSIVTIGALIGAVTGGPFAETFGRRRALQLISPIFLGSWLWQYFATSYVQLLVARVISGMGVGASSVTAPVYIAEVTPARLRGAMGGANQLFINLGIMFPYLLGVLFRTSSYPTDFVTCEGDVDPSLCIPPSVDGSTFCNWRDICLASTVPSLLLGICISLAPESPRWLAKVGQWERAQENHLRLYGEPMADVPTKEEADDATAEESAYSRAVIKKESATWSQYWDCRRQICIGLGLHIFQQFSGINSVRFYLTSIFQDAGIDNHNTMAFTVMCLQVVVTVFSCYLMDKAGRRVLFALGSIGMALSSALMGIFFLDEESMPGILAVVAAYGYVIFFSLGVGPIPWLMMAEIFPDSVRGFGASLATITNWSLAFLITKFVHTAVDAISFEAVFWFFSVCSVGSTVFAVLYVPETKGRTLEEIQENFQRKPKHSVDDARIDSRTETMETL